MCRVNTGRDICIEIARVCVMVTLDVTRNLNEYASDTCIHTYIQTSLPAKRLQLWITQIIFAHYKNTKVEIACQCWKSYVLKLTPSRDFRMSLLFPRITLSGLKIKYVHINPWSIMKCMSVVSWDVGKMWNSKPGLLCLFQEAGTNPTPIYIFLGYFRIMGRRKNCQLINNKQFVKNEWI